MAKEILRYLHKVVNNVDYDGNFCYQGWTILSNNTDLTILVIMDKEPNLNLASPIFLSDLENYVRDLMSRIDRNPDWKNPYGVSSLSSMAIKCKVIC